jgi:aspartyl-tRNA(Asn)/glutamyl-tRNA(Gln) amidotransferase subunit A
MALKDNFCVKGMATSCASRMLANFVPPYTASVAEKLENAGSILLGKLNMDEFDAGGSIFGAVKNPADPRRTAGRPSGGPAAAVAEDTAYFTIGSDVGGSVRQPSAFCGVVGLRPTFGRVSRFGFAHFASSLDQAGPLGKTVEDCAAVLSLIAGHDAKDPCTLPDPAPDYRAFLHGAEGLKGLRVGVPGEYMGAEVQEEIRQSVTTLAAALREAGAVGEECPLPHTAYALGAFIVISSAEFSSNMNRYDGVKFGYRAGNYENYDDMLRRTRTEAFGDEVKRRILFGAYMLRSGNYHTYFLQAQKARALVMEDFRQAFSKFDLLLTPATPVTAWPLDKTFGSQAEAFAAEQCTVSASLAGLPAISIPWGEDGEGLPIGIQLIGPALSEGRILQAAHGAEELYKTKNKNRNGRKGGRADA